MKYLLDAPDEEMIAWKAEAARVGVPFAEWLRQAARHRQRDPSPFCAADVQPREKPGRPASAGGKRTYQPDPTPTSKK